MTIFASEVRMSTKTGGTGEVRPGGDAVKDALRWLSARRRDEPQARLAALIQEASVRYDLSPREEEWLLHALSEK